MCVALIGGMNRLERHYPNEAERVGIEIKVFNSSAIDMASKVRNVDAMIVFTNKVSHRMKREMISVARTKKIPLLTRHSCGLCTLRDCFNCLKTEEV